MKLSTKSSARLTVRSARRFKQALLGSTSDLLTSRKGMGLAAGVLTSLISAGVAFANPVGGQVTAGSAAIDASTPRTLNVVQSSDKAIINWQAFSVGQGETVNFAQPSQRSVTLNRVTGADPSAIFGAINANGVVMLVNPNGVVFGPTSHVDVAGLIATTANISDANFLAGRYNFDQASTNLDAAVVNAGQISIKGSGLAALVAPQVENSGVINARLGHVSLGGAQTFSVDFQGDGMLTFDASSLVTTAPVMANGQKVDALVVNSGRISADGGTVQLTAQAVKDVVDHAINMSGVIEARSVGGQDGKIVLSGGDGAVAVSGAIAATGQEAGSTGGVVVVTGGQVDVTSGAVIDASGQGGGGRIAVGSDEVGQTLSETATLEAGARITADATSAGSGGAISLLSSANTIFAGSISAKGGALGGDGGSAEVSSHQDVTLSGAVDLTATAGKTGSFLLDPAAIEITDSSASVNTGATNDVVSRGWLESQSSGSNITLSATGLITIDSMAGGRISLATTAGNTFTLQSTNSGGIVFLDPATLLSTQGGAIVLQAQGVGSTISLGKLTTNGGAVSVLSASDITVNNAINAGAGAVLMQSATGNIVNGGGAGALITGGSVSLSALSGNLGSANAALQTATSTLGLETGGDFYGVNTGALTNLSIKTAHVLPSTIDTYQLTSNGLSLDLTDGLSLAVNTLTSASPLNLTLATDRAMTLGTVNVGAGAAGLIATGGDIGAGAEELVSAGSLNLQAYGAIGSSARPLQISTGALTATAGSAGVDIANSGALNLTRVTSDGGVTLSTTGTLTVGAVTASGSTVSLASTAGSILDDGDSTTAITADALALNAAGSVGLSGSRIASTATTVDANAASGGVFALLNGASAALHSVVSGDGAIDIVSSGGMTATNVVSSTSNGTNSITLTAKTGAMQVGVVSAGTAGDVTLTTQDPSSTLSSITAAGGSSLITGNHVTLVAPQTYYGGVNVNTAASTLTVTAGTLQGSGNAVVQTGAVTLDSINVAGGSAGISITNTGGDITVGSVTADLTGSIQLKSTDGSILNGAPGSGSIAAGSIAAGTVSLNAGSALGSSTMDLKTNGSSLTLAAAGDIYVDNAQALTSLSVTDNHAASAPINTVAVTSPYLVFNVTEDGSKVTLGDITDTLLGNLGFTTDQSLVLGHVQASSSGTVSLVSTGGSILDDGDASTRVTGSSVTLKAAGAIGTAGAAIDVDAPRLSLTTAGNVYVGNVADLSTLSLTSTHANPTANYDFVITAPSLTADITDSADGYAFNTLTDITGLAFTFSGDRALTLGALDVTRSGTLNLKTSSGAIVDDGVANTLALAGTIILTASHGAIGSALTPLTLIAKSVTTSAGAGGIYATLAMPTNSLVDQVTFAGSATGGPIAVMAEQGDLLLGSISASGQHIDLTASNGSILNVGGQSINAGSTGVVDLIASGSIGAAGQAINLASPATVNATSTGNGPIVLAGSAGLTLGTVNAGTGAVTLTASGGNIVEATGGSITGSSVTLSAASGSIGASGSALSVTTPKLNASAFGSLAIADTVSLTGLSLTSTASSAAPLFTVTASGLTFSASDSAGLFTLNNLASTSAMDFALTANHGVAVTAIDTDGGSASVTSTSGNITIGDIDAGSDSVTVKAGGSILDDGSAATRITAGTVTLTAGGSIGGPDTGSSPVVPGSITLSGASSLTATAGGNFYITDDRALTNLALASTATGTAANVFSITTAGGQTIGITDDGAGVQTLTTVSGGGLSNFSFSNNKNIGVGTIAASGAVSLATAGSGANSNIYMAGGGTGISAGSVSLTTSGGDDVDANIGASGARILVSTSSLTLKSLGDIQVADGGSLGNLTVVANHVGGSSVTDNAYYINASNFSSGWNIFDGETQSLEGLTASGLHLSYTADRHIDIASAPFNLGASGSIALTATRNGNVSNPTSSITDSSGARLTAGSVSLSALATDSSVGYGVASILVNTANLSLASALDMYVSDNTALSSLGLNVGYSSSTQTTPTYVVSATNLSAPTISYNPSDGTYGLNIANLQVSSGNLALGVSSNSLITVGTINTGSSGSVTLTAGSTGNSAIQAHDAGSRITTGDLTLNGSSVYVYNDGSDPLLTTASSLAGVIGSSAYISNTGNLTLKSLSAGSSLSIVTSGSMTTDGVSTVTAPNLSLTATNGSLGSSSAALLTDSRALSLVSGNNIYIGDKSDLYSLSVSDSHVVSQANTLQVTAPQLTFAVTDDGATYDIHNVVDASGLDFSFTGDHSIQVGAVNGQAGRSVAVTSRFGDLTIESGAGQLTGDVVSLTAGGSIGASGSGFTTNALNLAVSADADIYVHNTLDLSALSLTSTQTGATGGVYSITAPQLTFVGGDDGTNTHIDTVTDTTGLNFSAYARHNLQVGTINTTPSSTGIGGIVSLTSSTGISGASAGNHVTAAQAVFDTYYGGLGTGGDVGSSGTPINLSSPLLTLTTTGGVYLNSDTHIDSLGWNFHHYGSVHGGYAITSVGQTFDVADSSGGTTLGGSGGIADATGLALSVTSDASLILGAIDLGAVGAVTLSNTSGSILGDGDSNTQVKAASLALSSTGGSIGTSGAGNEIDATVSNFSANTPSGGVYAALHGLSSLSGLSANGPVVLSNSSGDVALGSVSLNGNTFSFDNQDGSILSGSLSNAGGSVSLTAAGSIGNVSAININSNGGATTLTATAAANARGATGSVAVAESSYGSNLTAASVTGPGGVSLTTNNGALVVGSIDGGSSAVSLTASGGAIVGVNTSNLISGGSVNLTANQSNNSAQSIGSSGVAINVATPVLGITNQANVYVSDSSALTSLTVDRRGSSTVASGGTISLAASGLSASLNDGAISTLTGTGLAFSFYAQNGLSIGTINVGSTGSVTLKASGTNAAGSITATGGGSLITAGAVNLASSWDYTNLGGTTFTSSIGTSGQFLNVHAGSVTASAPGTGGLYLSQNGDINLGGLSSGGDLSVTTTGGGDILVDSASYGSGHTLTLNAGGGIMSGAGGGLSIGSGTVNLTAVNGIGSSANAFKIAGGGAGVLSTNVTGSGGLYLAVNGSLTGGLTATTSNGPIVVTDTGALKLTNVSVGTDALGNDITVTSASGDITADQVTTGGSLGRIDLTANGGRVVAASSSSLVSGYAVNLYGSNGIGTSSLAVGVGGQRISAVTPGAGIYLATSGASALANVNSGSGAITVTAGGRLLLGNLHTTGGTITVNGGANTLIAGAIDAGTGAVNLNANSSGGLVVDDGDSRTRIAGGAITLIGNQGVGASATHMQTTATSLTLADGAGGGGIFLDDANTSGVTVTSSTAGGGATVINTSGATTATSVSSTADSTGNSITLTAANGDLTMGSVSAGSNNGVVTLTATNGAILGTGSSTNVTGHSASLSAATNIGALTNLLTGAGTPIKLAVGTLTSVSSASSTGVIALSQSGALTLGAAAVSLPTHGSVYIQASGNLDASAVGASLGATNLALVSGGTLTLPTASFGSTGSLYLSGAVDVVSSGNGRTVTATAGTLKFRSASTGGATTLTTTAGNLDLALTGAGNLTVTNTGAVSDLSLTTSNGDIGFTNTVGFNADSVTAGGSSSTASLEATTGDLTAGTVSAGALGTVNLTADAGKLLASSGGSITAGTLNLTSYEGIGSASQAYQANQGVLSAQVTGTGDIHLSVANGVTLQTLNTHAGDINVAGPGSGTLVVSNGVTAGGGGGISLTNTGGALSVSGSMVGSALNATANTISVAAMSTLGAQHYTGATTFTGDVTASAVTVTGALTLGGTGARAVDTSDANGGITVTGALTGAGHALTLASGSGAIALGGVASGLPTLTAIGGSIALSGVTTTGAQLYTGPTILSGAYATSTGAFTVDGAVQLAGNVGITTAGQLVHFAGAVDGAHDLTISSGAAGTTFDGAVGGTTRLGALAVNSSGATSFNGAVKAASLVTDVPGSIVLAGGSVDTTGALTIGEALALTTDTVLTGGQVVLKSVDATTAQGQSLTVNGGSVLMTGQIGATKALNRFTVNGATTLATDITVNAASTAFSGDLEATTAGVQGLTVDGDLSLSGKVGDSQALKAISVTGATSIGGSVTTTGDQAYQHAVTITNDASLTASASAIVFGDTVDAVSRAGLNLQASGKITATDAVGGHGALGALTIAAGDAVTFGGDVTASAITQTATAGVTAYQGHVTADGSGGINLSGAGFTFAGPLTASGGAIAVNDTDANGTIRFGGAVSAATGVTQTGGAAVILPASIASTSGPISFGIVADLPDGAASITTNGDITFLGLNGPQTQLTMASGRGALKIGVAPLLSSNPRYVINVQSLSVPRSGAASAKLYGSVAGHNDFSAAPLIDSPLRGGKWFINDTPWGPLDTIGRIVATVVPHVPVPSTPGVVSLFSRFYDNVGITPNAVGAFVAPQVLRLSSAAGGDGVTLGLGQGTLDQ